MAQPTWEFVVANAAGTNLGILTLASDRQVTYQRNGPAVLEFQVPLTSDQATLITPGVSRIKGYRAPEGGGTKTLRFHGIVWTVEQQASDTGVAMMKVVAVDPAGTTLARRFTSANYGTADQGTVMKGLVDDANAISDTFVETSTANVVASTSRTLDWSLARKSIIEAFGEIATADLGTDWELRPVDNGAKIASLYVYGGQRGSTRDEIIFGYGDGTVANCIAFQQTWNMDKLATWAQGDGQGGAYWQWTNPTKVAKFGRYERFTNYGDVVNTANLSQLVYQELVRSYDPVPVIGFTAGVRAPRMFDEWDIGDTVRVQARRGALNVNTTARIIGVTLQIDGNGVELLSSIVTQGDPDEEAGSTNTGVS